MKVMHASEKLYEITDGVLIAYYLHACTNRIASFVNLLFSVSLLFQEGRHAWLEVCQTDRH